MLFFLSCFTSLFYLVPLVVPVVIIHKTHFKISLDQKYFTYNLVLRKVCVMVDHVFVVTINLTVLQSLFIQTAAGHPPYRG